MLVAVAMLAIDAGVGPETVVTGAPATGVKDPVMAVMVEPVLLAMVMVTVRLVPTYRQDDEVARLAVNLLIASDDETAADDETVAPFCAFAAKLTVPLAATTELQLKMIVPEAPATSDIEPPTAQVGLAPTPTHVAVGGLGLETTVVWVALELFLTVMRN